jgi:RNA recognition motif-containing protein
MTVFVSSLPYETTTTDLITHFSFIGPVKNGFVVKDKVRDQAFLKESALTRCCYRKPKNRRVSDTLLLRRRRMRKRLCKT